MLQRWPLSTNKRSQEWTYGLVHTRCKYGDSLYLSYSGKVVKPLRGSAGFTDVQKYSQTIYKEVEAKQQEWTGEVFEAGRSVWRSNTQMLRCLDAGLHSDVWCSDVAWSLILWRLRMFAWLWSDFAAFSLLGQKTCRMVRLHYIITGLVGHRSCRTQVL